MTRTGPAALALAALLSGAASAQDDAALPAATKWQMDYSPTECRLLRGFGPADAQVTVQFSQVVPGPHLDMTLVGRRIRATDAAAPTRLSTTTVASIDAAAQGFPAQGQFLPTLSFQPNDRLRAAMASDVAQDKPTRLGVDARGYDVALDLGPMKGPLAALDKCMDDLVRSWGLDPAEQSARRTGPEPVNSPAEWFRPDDYPAEQRRAAAGGLVIMRLTVGPDGRVANCAVAKAGGDKAFEDLTCRLATERARFTPATGASGQPIASYWARRIRWQPGAPFVVRGS